MVALIKLYSNGEELVDSTRGDCPNCSKGYLAISLTNSFKVVIGNHEFSFDVVMCDRCDYTHLEQWVSESDKIKINPD